VTFASLSPFFLLLLKKKTGSGGLRTVACGVDPVVGLVGVQCTFQEACSANHWPGVSWGRYHQINVILRNINTNA
jgi:hypothetical protein